jgi:hypothetical protein
VGGCHAFSRNGSGRYARVVLLANDVRSSLDSMFSEPPAMLDMAIVLLHIGDEATED